ncbi:MAG: hypothetical protein IRY90_18745, partial [Actinomadura rubrobrunea]|nr:hypothetical protein [Actinomadura rubrobrunea]
HRQTLRPAARARAVGPADAGRDRGARRATAPSSPSSPSAPSRSAQGKGRRADRVAETPVSAKPVSGPPSSASPDGALAPPPPTAQPSTPVSASPVPGPWLIVPPRQEDLRRRIAEIRRRLRDHADRSGFGDDPYSADAARAIGIGAEQAEVEGDDPKPYLP